LIRRALKGGEVSPIIASKVMIYTYATTFNINPLDAYNTPASLVKEMLDIHGEVKKIESEEIEKMNRKR
tara:strand:+ start:94 stop:300 length:207 start_codon:yes stop_codon:yes gene_type:complete